MNQIRSLLQRTFGVLKQHVGTDHLGNKYYVIPEQKTWTGQTIRKRRMVETTSQSEHAYQTGDIPSEWDAWIRGRRKDPPTPEELLRNEQNREDVKIKSQEINERDKVLQDKEYKEGLVSGPVQTVIKGHASATHYGDSSTSQKPSSTANAFEPGAWTPQGGSKRKE